MAHLSGGNRIAMSGFFPQPLQDCRPQVWGIDESAGAHPLVRPTHLRTDAAAQLILIGISFGLTPTGIGTRTSRTPFLKLAMTASGDVPVGTAMRLTNSP